jgi:anaerobic ribonucleoside-triphosphate reductase activating protein
MRYAKIKKIEIENGKGIGTSLFVQGCPIHCPGCHNPETWDFEGGEPWTQEVEDEWFEHMNHWYVDRVTILGGEPLAVPNIDTVMHLIHRIKDTYPDKEIWLYTGYTLDENQLYYLRDVDVIVDGPYIESQRNISLPFRGSENQRILER